MKKFALRTLLICSLGSVFGCESSSPYRGVLAPYAPDTGHHDLWDAAFRRRHRDFKEPVAGDPMLEVARDLTMLEDDIRRDGSITVKKPDVWGDGNLMASIQEYERLMSLGETSAFNSRFSESVQAYIARSDQGEFLSATAIGAAIGGGTAPAVTSVSTQNILPTAIPGGSTPFALLTTPTQGVAAPTKGVALEPTELDRERSTFIHANQALRRRMIGDDNSRAAGYGLYLFRIPVSVLPGRETTEGYSAVATLRAQLQVDHAHLRNTFPKMVIADLVEALTPRILNNWKDAKEYRKAIQLGIAKIGANNLTWQQRRILQTASYKTRIESLQGTQTPGNRNLAQGLSSNNFTPASVPFNSHSTVYGDDAIDTLVDNAIEQFENSPDAQVLDQPKAEEIRQFLFATLEQTHNALKESQVFDANISTIAIAADAFVKGQYDQVGVYRAEWNQSVSAYALNGVFESSSWLLALQSGIFDRNLKKILNDLQASGGNVGEHCAVSDNVQFYASDCPEAVLHWETIIRQTFPLQVFNLDPIVEQQNAYDAFSRRREMQVALAFSVAKGTSLSADQKLKMSRKLALDEATIGLNRTAVAFAHGDDTFGWYFHPRIQTPPTESTNIGALARTIWSTGPTDNYDRKHRRLEPGIRDCEVLIAMPSFVTEVSFDVTTNWEKVARPGVTKRSYEEMIAQGGRLHRLRNCMQDPKNQNCYRPGDYGRLISRIDQLETMLGMQTHDVKLPYQYEQTGGGLFDSGKKQLRPTADYYYGLTYLDPALSQADLFIAGKNFHPTLTHVIVGGSEQHISSGNDSIVEVISRELIRVRVGKLNESLSDPGRFEVRVATPAGMSNPLVVNKRTEKKAEAVAVAVAEPKSDYDLVGKIELAGSVGCKIDPADACGGSFCLINPPGSLRIAIKTGYPYIQSEGFSTFTLERQRTDANKVVTKEPLGTTPTKVPFRNLQIDIADFANAIRPLIEPRIDFQAGDVIVVTGSLDFLNPSQPRVDMTTKMSIKIDLNRCATIPPATNVLPPPASNRDH